MIIPTNDDYNLYSLQRPIYPEDPLFIIPQPTEWVQLACEDGYIVKKLFTQEDDWLVFWQQMKAECENHKRFEEGKTPVVITTEGDGDVTPPPDKPETPDTNPDQVPGPGTQVTTPVTPPAPSTTPTPEVSGPYGWPWEPPEGIVIPPNQPNPHIQPSIPPSYHWGAEADMTVEYMAWNTGVPVVTPDLLSCEGFAYRIAWGKFYEAFFAIENPYKYITTFFQPYWLWRTGMPNNPGSTRHDGFGDCAANKWDDAHQSQSQSQYYSLILTVRINQAIE